MVRAKAETSRNEKDISDFHLKSVQSCSWWFSWFPYTVGRLTTSNNRGRITIKRLFLNLLLSDGHKTVQRRYTLQPTLQGGTVISGETPDSGCLVFTANAFGVVGFIENETDLLD